MGIALRASSHEIVLTGRGPKAGIVKGMKALEFSSCFFMPCTSESYGVSFHNEDDVSSCILLEKDVAWNAPDKSDSSAVFLSQEAQLTERTPSPTKGVFALFR